MVNKKTLAYFMLTLILYGATHAQQFNLLGSYDLTYPASEIIVEDGYAYVPDADAGLIILDVTDPGNVILVEQGPPETRVQHITKSGDLIYASRNLDIPGIDSADFKIIDVSNPASLVLISQGIMMGDIYDIEFANGYVFVLNSFGNRLNAIDVSDPYNPFVAGSFRVTGALAKLQIVGNTAYVITYTHGLRILDITDPLNPAPLGYCYTPGESYDLFVRDQYAFIADPADLTIIDISSPSSPSIIQDTTQIFCGGNIIVHEDLVFTGAFLDNLGFCLVAVDVQDLSDPRVLCAYPIPLFIYVGKPVVWNNWLFVPRYGYDTKLLIFDASVTGIEDNPAKPECFTSLDSYPNPFNDQCEITFTIPVEANVEIDIFNLLGQKVESLYSGLKQSGTYALRWEAGDYPSGLYLARLRVDGKAITRKMLFLK